MARTRLSSKGQVIIPKDVRQRHGWQTGDVLEVEENAGAVVLPRARLFPRAAFEQVRGCLKYGGPPLTTKDMDEAVAGEAQRMWAKFERKRR